MTDMTPDDHLVQIMRHVLNSMNNLERLCDVPVSDKEKHILGIIMGTIQTLSEIEKHIERLTGTDYDCVKTKLESLKKQK